jgi:DNA-binding response OmpR family regulator
MLRKILIIDDEVSDRKAMAIALEKDGFYNLFFAETAQQGLELARLQSPDVIIIDVVLDKGSDGFDVCIQLRKENCESKIIMVTGHLDAVNAKIARVSGADEIIEKTPAYKNLGTTIKNIQ